MSISVEDFNDIITEFQRLSEKEERARIAMEKYKLKVKTTEEFKQRQRDTFKRYYQRHREDVRAKQKIYYEKRKALKKLEKKKAMETPTTTEIDELIEELPTSEINKYIDSDGTMTIEDNTIVETTESEN
jgi:NAD-dependent SIR2 family protein deacetylase